ncbi:MAG: U32 family peptidase [Candidatus Pacebacteria bacterium]|nr:U32 family peptidase [Candidatus Paceibacterota bacterium]
MNTKLELLAPAKNLKGGMAAVNAGADAVYIGAPKFGARSSAGNSLEDIKKLIEYAHDFRVRVYITINTILYDNELKEARDLIWDLYKIGADGIIFQDMAILEMDLPSIPLIASTQCDNYDLERIKFLESIGIKRVILARELSLEQVKEIRKNTNLELETFVHGALCASFSGRCYLSHSINGGSANRGECIQACRLNYSLIDNKGKTIADNKPLLCLKDFNLSNHLEELIDAGVTSFKIEGRLKDEDYVSNVVAYYRKKIDEIIKNKKIEKTSQGDVFYGFEPDVDKTFNRSYTTYFLKEREKNILSQSPKSIGKLLGRVKIASRKSFVLDRDVKVNNGDGLCFFDKQGNIQGSNVNQVEGNEIFLNDARGLRMGTAIYRNLDTGFLKEIENNPCKRLIPLSFLFKEEKDGVSLKATDNEYSAVNIFLKQENQKADKKEVAEENIKNQLSKLGGTIFYAKEIKVEWAGPIFMPISLINDLRRRAIDEMYSKRRGKYNRETMVFKKSEVPFIQKHLSYEWNVSNKLSQEFYKRHGVESIEPAFELMKNNNGKKVMTTKHCLRHYLGYCLREKDGVKLKEPLFLISNKGHGFSLKFDCENCQMEVYKDNKKQYEKN